jgi:hypothetical protein
VNLCKRTPHEATIGSLAPTAWRVIPTITVAELRSLLADPARIVIYGEASTPPPRQRWPRRCAASASRRHGSPVGSRHGPRPDHRSSVQLTGVPNRAQVRDRAVTGTAGTVAATPSVSQAESVPHPPRARAPDGAGVLTSAMAAAWLPKLLGQVGMFRNDAGSGIGIYAGQRHISGSGGTSRNGAERGSARLITRRSQLQGLPPQPA